MMKCLIIALVISIRTVVVIAFLAAVEPNRPHLSLSSDDEEVLVRRRRLRLSDMHLFLQTTTTMTTNKATIPSRPPSQGNVQSRRDLLMTATGTVAVAALGTHPRVASAAASIEGVLVAPLSASLPSGLLDSRVQGNVLAPPPYGMEGSDIFYPEYVIYRIIICPTNTVSSPVWAIVYVYVCAIDGMQLGLICVVVSPFLCHVGGSWGRGRSPR